MVCSLLLGLASLPCAEGKGGTTSCSSRGWFPSVCCSWVPCWATCFSCGGVEALGRAGCSQRHLHVKHCLELWLKVHHGHADWEHWQWERRGLHISQVTSELPAAPSQALRSKDRCGSVWGRGWHKCHERWLREQTLFSLEKRSLRREHVLLKGGCRAKPRGGQSLLPVN